jgi:HEAT repeat protein
MILLIDVLESHPTEEWNQEFCSALKGAGPNQRMFAAMMLGVPSPTAHRRTSLLREYLDDSDLDVQIAAIKSVKSLGLASNDIIESLAKKLLSNPHAGVQTAVVRALSTLGPRAGILKEMFADVVGNNRTPDTVRVGVAIILGSMGTQAVVPLCVALTTDACLEVRQIAALALRGIAAEIDTSSPDGKKMLKALRASVVHEKDFWTRERAAESLRALDSPQSQNEAVPVPKTIAPPEEAEYRDDDIQFEQEENWLLINPDALRRQKLKALIDATSPRLYTSAAEAAKEFFSLGKQEFAQRLTPLLNTHLRRAPQDTYIEKQAIASWVNAELRALGLAIRCPKTGRPAILIADIRSGGAETSRFRLEVVNENGRRERTFTTAHNLPELELIEDSPRLEGLAGLRRGRN